MAQNSYAPLSAVFVMLVRIETLLQGQPDLMPAACATVILPLCAGQAVLTGSSGVTGGSQRRGASRGR